MSSVKPLCKSSELKRCIATDMRWKRKQVTRSPPERLPNLRPSSPRNSRDEELKAHKLLLLAVVVVVVVVVAIVEIVVQNF